MLLLLCVAALALRSWRLEFQSLWWDEGVSIFLASQSIRDLTVAKDFGIDLHPPGYHLLLAGWTALAGPSVFSSRLLSVFAGVMTVPMVARFTQALGLTGEKRMSDGSFEGHALSGAAIVAGALAAVSPIDVFYSQESRMYPFLPAIGAASLLATVRVAESNGWGRWLVWAAVNAIGIYVFYYLAFLSATEGLVLLAIAVRSYRSGFATHRISRWAISQAALIIACVPWIIVLTRRLLGNSLAVPTQTEVHLTLIRYVLDNWQDFTVGFTSPPGRPVVLGLWAALTLIGAIVLCRRSSSGGAIALGAILVPLAAAGAVLLFRPFYYPRFALFVLVPLWALVAIGVTASARFRIIGTIAVALLVVGNSWTWYAERTTPRSGYAPDDYRTVFATLAERIQPGDYVLGGYPWQAGYARAYFWRFDPEVRYIRSPIDSAQIADLMVSSGRVWTITYSPDQKFDPDPVETALAARNPTAVIDQYGDTRVRLFAYPHFREETKVAAVLDHKIVLQRSAPLPLAVKPGNVIPVVLRWGGLAATGGDYTVFVHLVGPDGKLWGQVDSPPLHGLFSTREWTTGADIVDRYNLPVNPSAPPGEYLVEVGMYNPHYGERLTVGKMSVPVSDNQILVGTVTVTGD